MNRETIFYTTVFLVVNNIKLLVLHWFGLCPPIWMHFLAQEKYARANQATTIKNNNRWERCDTAGVVESDQHAEFTHAKMNRVRSGISCHNGDIDDNNIKCSNTIGSPNVQKASRLPNKCRADSFWDQGHTHGYIIIYLNVRTQNITMTAKWNFSAC